jgi:hypothetical protein
MSGGMIYWNCRLYRWKLVLMIEVGKICVRLNVQNIITSIRHRHVLELWLPCLLNSYCAFVAPRRSLQINTKIIVEGNQGQDTPIEYFASVLFYYL